MVVVWCINKMAKKVICKMQLHMVNDQYPVHKTSIKLKLFLVKQVIPFRILIMTFDESVLRGELLWGRKY